MEELETLRWVLGELERVVGMLREKVEPEPGWAFYSQRDPRWRDDRLGPDVGGGTLGGAGCAVTCAAMICTSVGCEVTPAELNEWLIGCDGFSRRSPAEPRNQLRWEKVPRFCPAVKYEGRMEWQDRPADVDVVREILKFGPVVAQVDFDPRDRDVDEHYVVLLEWREDNTSGILIADPWHGDRVGLVERYYNPAWPAPKGRIARVITGLRLLQAVAPR